MLHCDSFLVLRGPRKDYRPSLETGVEAAKSGSIYHG